MRTFSMLILLFGVAAGAAAQPQIRVDPTGVNVNAHAATVVFLTYGGLGDYVPVEALWCGDLIEAFPDVGTRCDPGTVLGSLPLRSYLGRPSGIDGFTDIMSIPPSVARRAYQAAASGADSRFFYVRRFAPPAGSSGPDVFVAVTCRLTGGGARVPFALLDVRMRFATDASVLSVRPGEPVVPIEAEIAYNGTGQLRGRWEVVRPGEEPPAERDLLTEATLPIDQRSLQRRYTELERFSLFLPPSTRTVRLPGPDPARLPTDADGLYLVLLRIEATNDREGDSDLQAAGAGTGVVHTGAVAGFPLPVLRYYVGGHVGGGPAPRVAGTLHAVQPADGDTLAPGQPVDFSWTEMLRAALYQLDVEDARGQTLLRAVVPASLNSYRAPSWLTDAPSQAPFRWRIEALDFDGAVIGRTPWRHLFGRPASLP